MTSPLEAPRTALSSLHLTAKEIFILPSKNHILVLPVI